MSIYREDDRKRVSRSGCEKVVGGLGGGVDAETEKNSYECFSCTTDSCALLIEF